jgi:hypothetical protein
MNRLICPNSRCRKTAGFEVYAIVVERGVAPTSTMRWLRIGVAPDGHLEGNIMEHLPQW